MIYPKKNRLIRWFFHNYILQLVKSNFRQINYNDLTVDENRSVLLLANHFSWWDGFILYYINQKVLKKRFHVMVIEDTVQKVSFFKYMGAFSVNKGSRGMLASLNYAAGLLNDPQNMVLIFPQGKLYSNFTEEIKFEKGLSKIVAAAHNFHVIMAATFIENRQHKKPSVNVYLKAVPEEEGNNFQALQKAYQNHYNSSKLHQTEIVI